MPLPARKWLWIRIPEPLFAEAQDDATILAIRAQAPALEGIVNPGKALDRSGNPNRVPRIVG